MPREAPYSLAELAQYVDLAAADRRSPRRVDTLHESRNVSLFDRLRRESYVTVAEWRPGGFERWDRFVRERADVLAGEIGREHERGEVRSCDVRSVARSVAGWVWNKYTGDRTPIERAAREAVRRARERERQAEREARRGRSRVDRETYLAPARRRRYAAAALRAAGQSLRAIASSLGCSVAEIHRLLHSSVRVQGSPGVSDLTRSSPPATQAPSDTAESPLLVVDGAFAPELTGSHADAAHSAASTASSTTQHRAAVNEQDRASTPLERAFARFRAAVERRRREDNGSRGDP